MSEISTSDINQLVVTCANELSQNPIQKSLRIYKLTVILARHSCTPQQLLDASHGRLDHIHFSTDQRNHFARLQIRCNKEREVHGMTPLPLLQLSPRLLLDYRAHEVCNEVENITPELDKGEEPGLAKKKHKKKSKNKAKAKVKDGHPKLSPIDKKSAPASVPEQCFELDSKESSRISEISDDGHESDEGCGISIDSPESGFAQPDDVVSKNSVENEPLSSLLHMQLDHAVSSDFDNEGGWNIVGRHQRPRKVVDEGEGGSTFNRTPGKERGRNRTIASQSKSPSNRSSNSMGRDASPGVHPQSPRWTMKPDLASVDYNDPKSSNSGLCGCYRHCCVDAAEVEEVHRQCVLAMVKRHEEEMSAVRDTHFQAMQALNLRLFIANSALENERENRMKMIEDAVNNYPRHRDIS